ncbi:AGAP001091-PB [Anopheles gambiae str. PEST]|uniref:N-terminal kinase-like protein n=2 Tax=gambiae species complex TaxID=44542 RepID=F5HM19_ANOGA|nr:N-terminal kinase-like protein isoform X2 [Anopheles coluzzii]EGK97330.1 AGAP001091-PB [Anopheles gambiae str. PEST]
MWSFFSRDSSKDFPYEIGDPVQQFNTKSIWSLFRGKRKGSNDEVSVFTYDIKNGSDIKLELARAALKRLKTLRHPSILQFLDSLESDKVLYVATEPVEPLGTHIGNLAAQGPQRDLYLAWGIFQITRALSFLNNDGNLRHNNVSIWSVFINTSGEWKLGGLEYVSSAELPVVPPIKIPPSLEIYDPPEKNDASKIKTATKCSSDMWGLGCLVWESFNEPLKTRGHLKNIERIPKSLAPLYCELVGATPANRPNPADVITKCRKPGGFFKNDLVDSLLFLEEIQIKDKIEKMRFFSSLTAQIDNFPDNVCRYKILPQLITAYEYGDAGSAVLAPMFKLGRLLDEGEYQKRIVPCVVKLFASTDRVTRSRLLQQLDLFISHLQPNVVNDQIFPQIAHGFLDTNPTIREQTVKSIIHLAPKLNYNNLNVEVLRHFARLQSRDDQGGIRTNTTVCLGKIAPHLHPQVRQRVLVSAFIRAMRDPFPPSRVAGILALAATQQYFLLNEVAIRILPALCPLTTDPEKSVRDPAFKTLRGFLGKLEKVSEDPSLRESMEADVHTATPSLGNAAATWAGWAVTAVTAKFYRSQSDTARPKPPLTGKTLSKPASLEQPSSSSISTTTSSVTSMTSLEHESADTSASVSDYGPDNWDQENWGDMDTSQDPSSPMTGTSNQPNSNLNMIGSVSDVRDGWDNEDWGSLEEDPNETELNEKDEDELNQVQPKDEFTTNNPTAILTDLVLSINNSHTDSSYNMGRAGGGSSSNNSTTNTISSSLTENTVKAVTTNSNSRSTCNSTNANNSNNNSINNQGNHINSPSKMIALKNMNNLINISSSNSNQLSDWNNIDDTGAGWGDGEFETLNESSAGNTKMDEARRKREDKKIQRQRELEAKRAHRTSSCGGAMKLGAKKI